MKLQSVRPVHLLLLLFFFLSAHLVYGHAYHRPGSSITPLSIQYAGQPLPPANGAAAVFSTTQLWSPSGSNAIMQTLNAAFGEGNWDHYNGYGGLDPDDLFGGSYGYIYLDGSDETANAFNSFLAENRTRIEQWVSSGGNLFLNAAPNQGSDFLLGFGGFSLKFSLGTTGNTNGIVQDLAHPIFNGPATPANGDFTGGYFAHAIIDATGLSGYSSLIKGENGGDILIEFPYGMGIVCFGGMTSPNFHSPSPNAFNWRANLHNYLDRGPVDRYLIELPTDPGSCDHTVVGTALDPEVTGGTYTVSHDYAGAPQSNSLAGAVFPAGETQVKWTIVDSDDVTYTSVTIVRVEDLTAPLVVTRNLMVALDVTGEAVITAAMIDNGSSDACGIATMTLSKTVFGVSDLGMNTVTLTVTDINGNQESETAEVWVLDFVDGSFVYNGTEQSLSVDGDQLPPGTLVAYGGNGRRDVGTQEVTANITGAGYQPLLMTADLTVTPAPLTVRADPQDKVYGEADPELTYTVEASELQNDDAATVVSGDLERVAGEDVGDYAINDKDLTASNYTINYVGADLTVTPAPLTVTADPQDKVYGEADPELTYVVETADLRNDDAATVVSGGLERVAGEDVGDYAINDKDLAAPNYTINYVGADLTVTPAPLTVTADPQDKVYGEVDPELTYVVETADLRNDDAATVVSGDLERVAGEDVGDYAINDKDLTASNYTINYVGAGLTVTSAPLTVTADPQDKVYGEADPELTYTVEASELRNDDAATVVSGSLERVAGEDVGDYAINDKDLTASNYTISYVGADLTVTPAPLTVTANPQDKVYGDSDPALTYVVETADLRNDDAATVVSGGLERVAGEDVGDYAINDKDLAAPNYTINYVGADLTVTPAPLTVRADPQDKVYGEADPELTYVVETADLRNDDAATVVSGGLERVAGEDVGDYAINDKDLTASNYAINYVGADLTITPAPLTVTAVTGQSKVYGQADPELTLSATGFKLADNGMVLTGALSRTPGEDVGAYAITRGTLGAGANYTISFTGADFTVTPATLTVTADPQGKVYGEADPVLTFSAAGFGLTDGEALLTGAPVRAPGEDVATYAITQGDLGAGTNYTIAFIGADLTITEAPLTVTADPQGKVYGDNDPTLTYVVEASDLRNGDAATVVSGSLERTPGENAGSYAIGNKDLTAQNYVISYVGADLTITKAPLTVTADPQSKVYGEADPALTYTVGTSGLKNGDAATVVSGSLERTPGENVGNYAINDKDLRAQNYVISYVGAELTVTPAVRTITFPAIAEKTYGDGDFVIGVTAGSGEAVSYASSDPSVATIVNNSQIRITGAGTATITASVPANPNYSGPLTESRTLTVRKAQQGITFQAPATLNRDAGRVSLAVQSSAGLPVTLSVDDPMVATVEGTDLLVHRLGTVTITATQAGDANHEAAASVVHTIRVEDPVSGIPFRVHPAVSPNGDGSNDALFIEGVLDYPDNRVRIFNRNGTLLWKGSGYDNDRVAFRGIASGQVRLPAGTYFYVVEINDNGTLRYERGYFVIRY